MYKRGALHANTQHGERGRDEHAYFFMKCVRKSVVGRTCMVLCEVCEKECGRGEHAYFFVKCVRKSVVGASMHTSS